MNVCLNSPVKALWTEDLPGQELLDPKKEPTKKCLGIILQDGKKEKADRVVLATGGVSYPLTGANGSGLTMAPVSYTHLEHRNATDDKVTMESALATKKYGVAVKCATITPNAARMTEYNLKEMWKSPNGTIRAALDGTVFRTPIVVKGIEPCVRNWKKPITLARHAYGDVYKNAEIKVPGAGKAELVFTAEDGSKQVELIHNFEGPGVIDVYKRQHPH